MTDVVIRPKSKTILIVALLALFFALISAGIYYKQSLYEKFCPASKKLKTYESLEGHEVIGKL